MLRNRILLALIAAFFVIASQRSLLGEHLAIMKESNSFRDATETRAFKHEVRSDAKQVTLKVRLKVKTGEAICRLRDPEGKVRWERSLGSGAFIDEQHFGAIAGVWQVEVDLKGASGRYSLSLKDS